MTPLSWSDDLAEVETGPEAVEETLCADRGSGIPINFSRCMSANGVGDGKPFTTSVLDVAFACILFSAPLFADAPATA